MMNRLTGVMILFRGELIMKKSKEPEKPVSEMSEAERLEAWRRKRDARGELQKPKGKKADK